MIYDFMETQKDISIKQWHYFILKDQKPTSAEKLTEILKKFMIYINKFERKSSINFGIDLLN